MLLMYEVLSVKKENIGKGRFTLIEGEKIKDTSNKSYAFAW